MVIIANKYGDNRRTEIVNNEVEQINLEDMIKDEDMVVMISRLGYIKRVSVTKYKKQGRGGTGSNSTTLLEDDYVNKLFIGSTKEYLLFITNVGRAYWLKIHEIPESEKTSRGAHIKGLLQVGPDEEITTIVSLKEFSDEKYLFMITAQGIIKKVRSTEFANARAKGIIGIAKFGGKGLLGLGKVLMGIPKLILGIPGAIPALVAVAVIGGIAALVKQAFFRDEDAYARLEEINKHNAALTESANKNMKAFEESIQKTDTRYRDIQTSLDNISQSTMSILSEMHKDIDKKRLIKVGFGGKTAVQADKLDAYIDKHIKLLGSTKSDDTFAIENVKQHVLNNTMSELTEQSFRIKADGGFAYEGHHVDNGQTAYDNLNTITQYLKETILEIDFAINMAFENGKRYAKSMRNSGIYDEQVLTTGIVEFTNELTKIRDSYSEGLIAIVKNAPKMTKTSQFAGHYDVRVDIDTKDVYRKLQEQKKNIIGNVSDVVAKLYAGGKKITKEIKRSADSSMGILRDYDTNQITGIMLTEDWKLLTQSGTYVASHEQVKRERPFWFDEKINKEVLATGIDFSDPAKVKENYEAALAAMRNKDAYVTPQHIQERFDQMKRNMEQYQQQLFAAGLSNVESEYDEKIQKNYEELMMQLMNQTKSGTMTKEDELNGQMLFMEQLEKKLKDNPKMRETERQRIQEWVNALDARLKKSFAEDNNERDRKQREYQSQLAQYNRDMEEYRRREKPTDELDTLLNDMEQPTAPKDLVLGNSLQQKLYAGRYMRQWKAMSASERKKYHDKIEEYIAAVAATGDAPVIINIVNNNAPNRDLQSTPGHN